MTQKIWKYPIKTQEVNFVLEMPEGANILNFDIQRGIPTLWVLVNPNNKFDKKFFRFIGTGDIIEEKDDLNYIGTIQMAEETLIFHLFKDIKE